MTSHLTVSATSGASTQPGPVAGTGAAAGSSGGIFGAILSAVQGSASSTGSSTPTSGFSQSTDSSTTSSGNNNLFATIEKLLGLGTSASGSATTPLDATDTAATATITDTANAAATTAGTPPKLMQDLVGALAELEKVQSNGDTPDQNLVKRLKKAVDAVSTFLATQPQLAAAPSAGTGDSAAPGAVTGTTTNPAIDTSTKDGQTTADALAAAKASISGLDDKLNALSASTGTLDPDLSGKLAALAKALDPTTISDTTLSQLGLNASSPGTDANLASAINALAATKAPAATGLQPSLATPTLKLPTQSALGTDRTSKSAATGIDHALSAPTTQVTGAASGKDTTADNSADNHSSDRKSADAQAAVAAADTTVHTAPATSPGQSDGSAAPQVSAPVAAATGAVAAKVASSAYQAATPVPVNLPQMAYEIARHAQQGSSHFQIRLDPADLGRVDVRMSVDASGTVNAQMSVERPETLDLLKRDAAQLSQAFTQAGLDGSKTTMQFSLSQNPFSRQGNPSSGNGAYAAGDADADADSIPSVTSTSLYRGAVSASGLNLFV